MSSRRDVRRRRLMTRTIPLAAVALGAFVVGAIVASGSGANERALVTRYVRAWARGDYSQMYSMLDAGSRGRMTESQFVSAYQDAASTATLTALSLRRVGDLSSQRVPVMMRVRTRVFGTLREQLSVPVSDSGAGPHVRYDPAIVFPGLREGEQLRRAVSLPPRAALLASDGSVLAHGPNRSSDIPDVASEIVGTLGPIPADQATTFAAEGYPPDAKVGATGLERVFESQLAGTPGGTLSAGARVLASTDPAPGRDVTTTIVPGIERAATSALAGRYGGIAVMDPRTGAIEALSGVAFSALQPPGSTMKMITATGALEAGVVKLTDTFPIRSSATIDGFTLHNAGDESCGGTFLNAFAVSCNSVFAPLGVKLGARRLVDIAQRFGFNEPPSIPGAAESVIPPANKIRSALDVGSSAIGQGDVQTTALEMADVGATIAMGGRRPIPTLQAGQAPRFVSVTSPRVAHLVQRMMIAVVEYGTGTAAKLQGVQVAGKTGTAELRDTSNGGGPQDTDAWFVGYAPVGHPTIVVGALFPENGAGGATAAPAVHDVLAAALHTH